LSFHLAKIEIIKSELTNLKSDFEEIKVGFNIRIKDNYENNISVLRTHLEYFVSIDGEEVSILHYDVVFVFKVDNLENIITSSDKEIDEKILKTNMISISYSTLRGIIFSETKGNVVNDLILPQQNPNTLFEKMKSEELKNNPDH
jgi:hypothetical protein